MPQDLAKHTAVQMKEQPLELIGKKLDETSLGFDAVIASRKEIPQLETLCNKESDRLQKDLADMLVHDMCAPLTNVIGAIMTLEDMSLQKLDNKEKELLSMALSSGRTLLGMVNDLLDISKIEQDKLVLDKSFTMVDSLIDAAVSQVRFTIDKKNINLSVGIQKNLQCIQADFGKLVRVLVNLLQNAARHTCSCGNISITASYAEVDHAVKISVSDDGEGISHEFQGEIFDKFVQAESYRNHKPTSCGLGLTFCKLAVEAHGGRILVESEPGIGSTFSFTIPV